MYTYGDKIFIAFAKEKKEFRRQKNNLRHQIIISSPNVNSFGKEIEVLSQTICDEA